MARITVAYAAVLVPASMLFVGSMGNFSRRLAAAGCGVLVVLAVVFAWRSLIIMAGGAPFVGEGSISVRLDAMVNSADAAHVAWGDDRVPYHRNFARPDSRRLAAKRWTLERDGEEFETQQGIQRWRVPPEIIDVIQGKHVQVNATAHGPPSKVLPELRYVAPYQSSSPWHQFQPGKPFEVAVPLTVRGNHHFVEVRDPDRAVEIKSIELVFPRFPANASEFFAAVPRIITNGFLNFWHAEMFGNVVKTEQFPNALTQGLQHVLLVLAAIGAARACLEFGTWVPVLAFWVGGILVGFDWHEERHNMPFMPAVCLLAGLGVTWLGTSLFARRSHFYSLPVLFGTTLLALGAMCTALDAFSIPVIAMDAAERLFAPACAHGCRYPAVEPVFGPQPCAAVRSTLAYRRISPRVSLLRGNRADAAVEAPLRRHTSGWNATGPTLQVAGFGIWQDRQSRCLARLGVRWTERPAWLCGSMGS